MSNEQISALHKVHGGWMQSLLSPLQGPASAGDRNRKGNTCLGTEPSILVPSSPKCVLLKCCLKIFLCKVVTQVKQRGILPLLLVALCLYVPWKCRDGHMVMAVVRG